MSISDAVRETIARYGHYSELGVSLVYGVAALGLLMAGDYADALATGSVSVLGWKAYRVLDGLGQKL